MRSVAKFDLKLSKDDFKNEVWKDIKFEKNDKIYDYIGRHQVSNMGRIESFINGSIKMPKEYGDRGLVEIGEKEIVNGCE